MNKTAYNRSKSTLSYRRMGSKTPFYTANIIIFFFDFVNRNVGGSYYFYLYGNLFLLITNILYIKCEYSLKIFGFAAAVNLAVAAKLTPKKLRRGDLCAQGLKYYGGRVKFTAPLANGNYKAEMNSLPAAIAYFNASPVAFLPYGTDFTVTDGTLTAEVVLTRCNTFGTTIKQGKREGLIVQGLPDDISLKKLVREQK